MLKATLCIPEHSRIDNSLQLTEEKNQTNKRRTYGSANSNDMI